MITHYSNPESKLPQKSPSKQFIAYFVCVAFATFTFVLKAQSSSETTDSANSVKLPEGYRILNELEAEAYQKERYEEFKKELALSSLSSEHQDLLAHALSVTYRGILVSSYQVDEIVDNELINRIFRTERMSVLETGHIHHVDQESRTHSVTGTNTPFSYREGIPAIPASGRVLEESDSEITFRFKVDVDFILSDLANSPIQLPEGSIQTERVKLVMDLTVDKNNRHLNYSTLQLRKPLRKLFIFTLNTLEFNLRYEFIEECGGSAIVASGFRTKGSVIFGGRLFSTRVLNYSEIQCEHPFRYVLPPPDSHVGLLVRF